MRKYTIIAVLVMAGCVCPKPLTPPMPKGLPPTVVAPPPAITPEVPIPKAKPPPTKDYYITFRYPSDSENWLWQLQQSTNNTNWTTIAPTAGNPTNVAVRGTLGNEYKLQYYWVGHPVSNYFNVTVPNGKTYYWRMLGTRP